MLTINDDPGKVLQTVCATYDRTFNATIYTIADIRHPEINGKRISAELVQGQHRFTWMVD